MGLREKVTIIFIVLVILQVTVNSLQLTRKDTNHPRARSNGGSQKHPLKYNSLQPTRNLENYKGQTEIYGDSIRKSFNFPEIEYSDLSKCFPINYQYQEPNTRSLKSKTSLNTQDLAYKSHNAFSTSYKKNIKKSISSDTKNEQNVPVIFPEFSSAPNYRDICNFPDVEYPLRASEVWKPYYWNSFMTDTLSNNNKCCTDKKSKRSKENLYTNLTKNSKLASSCGFNKGSEINKMIDKYLNTTLNPKQISLNVSSCNNNTTINIKKCQNLLLNEDKNCMVLSRSENYSSKLFPTEDRENEFGSNDEEYTTDDPEYQESSFYAQSTVAPPTWEKTKVVEMFLPDVDELNDYFISV